MAPLLLIRLFFTCLTVSASQIVDVTSPDSDTEMLLTSNDVLRLNCVGETSLVWLHQQRLVNKEKFGSRLGEETTQNGSTYISRLTLSPLHYTDTGEFACIDNSTDSTNRSSVYVYIYDGDHLLVDRRSDVLFTSGQRETIACRPTHPNVTVTLKSAWSDEVVALDDNVAFDRRTGFVVRRANSYFDGYFKCLASFDGSASQQMVIITYKEATVYPPKVEIKPNSMAALVGDTVVLRCFAYLHQDSLIDMKWFPPTQSTAYSNHTAPMVRGGVVDSSLTVYNMTLNDAGMYNCTATTHDKKTSATGIYIHLYRKPFINMTATNVTVNEGDTQRMTVDVHSYPKQPKLTWFKDGRPFTTRSNGKRIERVRYGQIRLVDVQFSDHGRYTVVASDVYSNSSVSFWLLVNVAPSVDVDSANQTFYMVSVDHSLVCRSHGYPTPTVYWLWQPCSTAACTAPRRSLWTSVSGSKNIVQSRDVKDPSVSRLRVIAKQSGFYRCTAHNNVSSASHLVRFVVTDVKDGFDQVPASPVRVVAGDNVSVECLANWYTYNASSLHWVTAGSNMSITSRARLTVARSRSDYSSSVKLMFTDVQRHDWKNYECVARNKHNDSVVVSQLNIVVIPMSKPVFTKKLGGPVTINPGVPYSIECEAAGRPQPVIVWKKDGSPLMQFNNTKLSFAKLSLSDTGVYVCVAVNRAGNVSSSITLTVSDASDTADGDIGIWIPVTGVGFVALMCIVSALILVCWKKHYRIYKKSVNPAVLLSTYLSPPSSHKYNPDVSLAEQLPHLSYDSRWEFPKNQLKLGRRLGQGAFGVVVRALAYGIRKSEPTTVVAVKMVKDDGNMEQLKILADELKILIHIGAHLNILNVLGAVTKDLDNVQLYVLMEYCRHGCLRDYLVSKRQDFQDTLDSIEKPTVWFKRPKLVSFQSNMNSPLDFDDSDDHVVLTKKDLVCYAYQIARGMVFLASQKIVHRDLAARNILLADGNVVKICDFGLAKDCYKYNEYRKKSNTPVPIKWMALESLTHKVYNIKTDVWSYGILLWELFTIGGNPYSTDDIDEHFIDKLKRGYRLTQPTFATNPIYEMMRKCWDERPHERPDFSELEAFFDDILETSVKQHYIELSSHYERPRTAATDNDLCGESVCCARPASVHVVRQQSMESGVFMSRPASSDLDASPRGYQRPVRLPSGWSSNTAADCTLEVVPRRRSQSTTDGYLLPTTVEITPTAACQQLTASRRQSVSATSDSDMWGSTESDNVFECSTLLI